MNRYYILIIIILIIALIFAIQNTAAIELHFLFWTFNGSQALVIILIFALGFGAGWLMEARKLWIKKNELKAIRKKLAEAEKPVIPPLPDSRK